MLVKIRGNEPPSNVKKKKRKLIPQHIKHLKESGIDKRTASANRVYSVSDPIEAASMLKWASPSDSLVPAIAFPFRNRHGKPTGFTRLRPDHPRLKDGRSVKYEQPIGVSCRAYFPIQSVIAIRKPHKPLILTEGEKKAIKADAEGFPCIGLTGVFAWQKKGQPEKLIPDLNQIIWKKRAVYIVFDSDAIKNSNVREAERRLSAVLRRRGAKVFIVRLPGGPDEKKVGLDDFLVKHGPEKFRKLLEDARQCISSDKLAKFNCTDVGNAERLAFHAGSRIKYCQANNTWYIWNGFRWKPDNTGEVIQIAKDITKGIYKEAEQEADPTLREKLGRHAIQSERAERISAMLRLAQSEPFIAVKLNQLDTDPWLLNCQNGTLDLQTGQLLEPKPDDLLTKSCSVDFDENAKCRTWVKYLKEVFENNNDLIRFIKRAVGYSLTGSTKERVLFFAYGTGKNGKSTLVTTIQTMMGDCGRQAPPNLLVTRHGEVHPTEIMHLAGSRFVAASETEEQRQLAESFVKQMTGGQDRLSGRYLYKDFVDFIPTHKLWLSGNHLPVIKGTDDAIWDRIKLIPFNVRFDSPDKELPARLLAELPGILNWAIEGCLEWQEHGLGSPNAVLAATQAYRSEMDVLGAFIEDICERGPGKSVMGPILFDKYGIWCDRSREQKLGRQEFYSRLEQQGFKRKRSGGLKFLGLSLK